MNKVSLIFIRFSDANLLTFAENVLLSLTGNANFATPSPTILAITALKDSFSVALSAAYDGGRTLVALKNAARKKLIDGLRLLASYVEDTAVGDYAALLSSGFDITTFVTAPRPVPAAPQNLRLSDGSVSGSVKVRVGVVKAAVVYEVRYTVGLLTPESKWVNLPASTSATTEILGLDPGKTVWVQVRSINSRGAGNWSDPGTIIVR